MSEYEAEVERDIYFFNMPVELHVSPGSARELLARYFGEDVELMREAHSFGNWGSHVLRAVLGIALEDDQSKDYDLVPRIADELVAQPQQLATMVGVSMENAARARAKMALFDARRINHTEEPLLSQFVERWR